MLVFAQEAWPDVVDEMKPLFVRHWQEIGVDRDVVLMDMDYEMYDKYHEIGYLKIVTVREAGKLVGYCMALLCTHLHYRSTLFGLGDLYYIAPEHRKGSAGLRMFMEMEKLMRSLGAKKLTTITKMHHDLSPMFEKLGWKSVEKTFSKVLD
jgi:N-acetylglutamate synthase-like GNAT family acetyltransferase